MGTNKEKKRNQAINMSVRYTYLGPRNKYWVLSPQDLGIWRGSHIIEFILLYLEVHSSPWLRYTRPITGMEVSRSPMYYTPVRPFSTIFMRSIKTSKPSNIGAEQIIKLCDNIFWGGLCFMYIYSPAGPTYLFSSHETFTALENREWRMGKKWTAWITFFNPFAWKGYLSSVVFEVCYGLGGYCCVPRIGGL